MLKGEGVYTEVESRTLALSYLISNLFEAKSLDECLDVAIKGLSMLDFFQSQINLLEDGYFVVKRNHMDKKYQFLLEQMWGQKFLGHEINARSPFMSHLLNSKIVATIDIKGAVKVKLEDIIREYLPKEIGANKRLGMLTRVVSIIPKRIDLLILPLNYQGKVIGAVGISSTSLEREDAFFLQNLCELFAQAFEKVQTRDYLRKSEKSYRELTESINDVFFAMDKDFRCTYWNKASERLTGISAKDAIGKSLTEVFPDVKGTKVERFYLDALKTKRHQIFLSEYRLGDKDFVFEIDAYPTENGLSVFVKDITERKKTEVKLRESEKKFRNIFENANDIIVYGDLKGTILDLNKKAAELAGIEKEKILGKNFGKLGLISLRDVPKLLGRLAQKALGKAETEDFQLTITRKDGKKRFLEVNSTLIRKGKIPAGFLAIARDITERKKAEQELKESEEKYRSLFTNMLSGFAYCKIIVDERNKPVDFVYLEVNDVFEKLTGFKKEDVIGKKVTEVIPGIKEAHPELFDIYGKVALTGKEDKFDIDFKPLDRWLSISAYSPKKGYFVAVFENITEQKKAEEKIIASEEKYRSLVELAPDSIMTFDLKGVITSVNTASTRMSGYSQDELVGKHFSKIGAIRARDVPKYLKMLPSTLRGKVPKPFEVIYHRKNGTLGFGEVRLSLMRKGSKITGIQAIMRDVTERKRMENELKRYSEHLEELVEERTRQLKESQEQLLKSERLVAIGELATMVGHDLRNPLQSIENATYYLNNELPHLPSSTPIPQKAIEMLQVINNSVNYADKIIRDLQDFSATKKPTLKKTNINTIVKETLSQVEAPENVELITELSRLPEIKTDKDMIKRVFMNLAVNGIQAMENGGRLNVSTKKTREFVEVSFKDTGVGMSKENMKKLFTPFFTTKAKGMGMGLAICKRFVDAHGGSIEAESKEGKGSTFTVKLPIQQKNGGENQ